MVIYVLSKRSASVLDDMVPFILSKFDKHKEINRIGQVHHNKGISHRNAAVWLLYVILLVRG